MSALESLKSKIKSIMEKELDLNDQGGYEIYTDYRDRELSIKTLKTILAAKHPMECFEDILGEWAMEYAMEYGEHELEIAIQERLNEEEKELYRENAEECWNFIQENSYFYYDIHDFNNDVKVNIMIDCGNWNYDCTCDNILNWNGRIGDGNIQAESSMLWLAKTQRKATALRKACEQKKKDDEYDEADTFVDSCIQELENLCTHMGTVTFLVKIPLFQLIELVELQNKEYDEQGKYDPRENKKSKSYLVIGKDVTCGLFNPWSGSGSVLEIELNNDVKVPIKYCVFCLEGSKKYGYDVDEVYGLMDSAWSAELKEIVDMSKENEKSKYKLRMYKASGDYDHEEFFETKKDMADRYKVCMTYNKPLPTAWELADGEWERIGGY